VAEVVARAADGNEEAWEELHRRYSRMIGAVARSCGCSAADASDVQQAVWIRLVRNIKRLHRPEAIGGWLAVVTRNECVRLCSKRPPTVDGFEFETIADTGQQPENTVLHSEQRSAVREAVAKLPPRRRSLLEEMLDHPDMGYEELASRLSMPLGSIGPTRQRSLDELRRRRELMQWHPSAWSA
jgi:RNA polymerase sigma factor (sigma-70 family)